jgi:PIN like domain
VRRRDQPVEAPLRFFLDRSLGRHIVAEALRASGLTVQTLAERYPENEELVPDETWIREATADGLVLLMKDDAIRRKPREQQAILESGARAFVVTNANLTGEQVAALYIENRNRITQRARTPGPYIYGVYPGRLERLFPRA